MVLLIQLFSLYKTLCVWHMLHTIKTFPIYWKYFVHVTYLIDIEKNITSFNMSLQHLLYLRSLCWIICFRFLSMCKCFYFLVCCLTVPYFWILCLLWHLLEVIDNALCCSLWLNSANFPSCAYIRLLGRCLFNF